MILETDQYDGYEIPVPPDIPYGKVMDYVLRQTGKRHPCLEEQCKADILVTGWGKRRKALVTVIADAVLLDLIAGQGVLQRMKVTEPVRRRIFRSGPVTQLHWQWWPFTVPVAAMVLVAAMTLAMKPAGSMELSAEKEGEQMELPVSEEERETDERLPEHSMTVGTIFSSDGGKTVFYRDESGKLKTLSVFAK